MTKRIDYIRSSAIRKIFDKAAGIKNVVNLSIGQPDFPVSEKIKDSLIKYIKENKTGYTVTAGIPDLRNKILKNYQGKDFAESIMITSGVSGGIFLAFSALLEEKDEIIILDPYFVMYPDLSKFINAIPVIVESNEDHSPNFNNLEKAITKKTKVILVNSPNNPTGYVYTKDELKKLAEIAKKHNLWIISDEVYKDYDYDNKFVSMGDFYNKTLVLGGFSKNFALTGLRIGYAVGPKEIIEDMIKLQQYTFVCAPSITQYAVAENIDSVNIKDKIDLFKKRRELVYSKLKDHFKVIKPSGAFYFFIPLPKHVNEEEFIERCLAKSLLVVPGSAFSAFNQKHGNFRISYAVEDSMLEKGLDILIEVIESFK